jgi:hypothetical protein
MFAPISLLSRHDAKPRRHQSLPSDHPTTQLDLQQSFSKLVRLVRQFPTPPSRVNHQPLRRRRQASSSRQPSQQPQGDRCRRKVRWRHGKQVDLLDGPGPYEVSDDGKAGLEPASQAGELNVRDELRWKLHRRPRVFWTTWSWGKSLLLPSALPSSLIYVPKLTLTPCFRSQNKMFVQEFGVPLTSITASPTDESFASHQDRPFDEDDDTASFTQVRNQRSFPLSKVSHPRTRVDSDASSTDECRTSMDTSADPVDIREHGRNDSANSSSSLFTSRGENSRPFMLKALRPVSGFSLESDSGADGDEDDTFAFQRQRVDAQEQQQQQYYDAPSVLSSSISSVPSTIPPFRVKDRPASMSSSIGHATANDTFQFLQQPNSKPSTFSHAVDDSFTQFELPSFCASADDSIYTLPVLIAPLTAREDPAPVSPLNISKRKAVLSQDEVSPRKARLVEATSQKEFEESMKGLEESRRSKESSRSIERGLRSRASLEDSCLVGSGEDSSFGSQGELPCSIYFLSKLDADLPLFLISR